MTKILKDNVALKQILLMLKRKIQNVEIKNELRYSYFKKTLVCSITSMNLNIELNENFNK